MVFLKFHGWFYGEFEYLRVGSHHSKLTNRLRHSNIDWHLSEEEMLEKTFGLGQEH
jgi:hypothetical protein